MSAGKWLIRSVVHGDYLANLRQKDGQYEVTFTNNKEDAIRLDRQTADKIVPIVYGICETDEFELEVDV